MVKFLIGFMIGNIVGIALFAIVIASKDEDR